MFQNCCFTRGLEYIAQDNAPPHLISADLIFNVVNDFAKLFCFYSVLLDTVLEWCYFKDTGKKRIMLKLSKKTDYAIVLLIHLGEAESLMSAPGNGNSLSTSQSHGGQYTCL